MSEDVQAVRVLALGQAHRGDDAFGLAVATRLERMGVALRLPQGDPLAVLDALRGCRRAIVVDVLRVSQRAVGSIVRCDLLALPIEQEGAVSTHGNALGAALRLGRELRCLPARIDLVGVVGGRFGLGEGLSPTVARAVPQAAREVLGLSSRLDALAAP
ncbi:MAG: hydrogenase maturation protease [Pseudomonadota bacterium]